MRSGRLDWGIWVVIVLSGALAFVLVGSIAMLVYGSDTGRGYGVALLALAVALFGLTALVYRGNAEQGQVPCLERSIW